MRVTTLLLAAIVAAGMPVASASATEAKKGEPAARYAVWQQQALPPLTRATAVTFSPAQPVATTPPCRQFCPITGQCLAR